MKKIFVLLCSFITVATLVGCDSAAEKQSKFNQQLQCIDRGLDKHCNVIRGTAPRPVVQHVDYDYNNVAYAPTMPGAYVNYYGDTRYGYWDIFGNFKFNDPYSSYASNTNSFLLGAGLGGLAAYAMTKTDWTAKNPGGWKSYSTNVKQPLGNKGEVITTDEANRRAVQSKKDKAAHQAKLKVKKDVNATALTKKQASVNATKAAAKPTATDIATTKAALKKKQEQRAQTKAASTSKFSNQNLVEKRVTQHKQTIAPTISSKPSNTRITIKPSNTRISVNTSHRTKTR